MFQVPPAMVNAGLVQLPLCCVSGTSTDAGPTTGAAVVAVVPPAEVVAVVPPAAVVAVVPPAAVVDVALPAAVVVVAPPAAVVEVAPPVPDSGGSLYPPPEEAPLTPEAEPAFPLNHMPRMAATTTAIRSCHVFHERRSLILRSPRSGW
jgi:hypothetical protein